MSVKIIQARRYFTYFFTIPFQSLFMSLLQPPENNDSENKYSNSNGPKNDDSEICSLEV
ncbi:13868_t:CDS:2, partial [Gigaspora rosea]